MNTIVGGGTGSATADIVRVRGTRSMRIGDWIWETVISKDTSNAAVGGGYNVTTRNTRKLRKKVSFDSDLKMRSVSVEMDWSKLGDGDSK